MATILRKPGSIYNVYYDKVPLEKVALSERTELFDMKNASLFTDNDEFLNYVRPLIGDDWPSVPLIDGRQRFTKFKPVFAEKKLDKYLPEAYK